MLTITLPAQVHRQPAPMRDRAGAAGGQQSTACTLATAHARACRGEWQQPAHACTLATANTRAWQGRVVASSCSCAPRPQPPLLHTAIAAASQPRCSLQPTDCSSARHTLWRAPRMHTLLEAHPPPPPPTHTGHLLLLWACGAGQGHQGGHDTCAAAASSRSRKSHQQQIAAPADRSSARSR